MRSSSSQTGTKTAIGGVSGNHNHRALRDSYKTTALLRVYRMKCRMKTVVLARQHTFLAFGVDVVYCEIRERRNAMRVLSVPCPTIQIPHFVTARNHTQFDSEYSSREILFRGGPDETQDNSRPDRTIRNELCAHQPPFLAVWRSLCAPSFYSPLNGKARRMVFPPLNLCFAAIRARLAAQSFLFPRLRSRGQVARSRQAFVVPLLSPKLDGNALTLKRFTTRRTAARNWGRTTDIASRSQGRKSAAASFQTRRAGG